jgi:hypothetical protein
MRERHEESMALEQKALYTIRPSATQDMSDNDDSDAAMKEETKSSKKIKRNKKSDFEKKTLNKEELEKIMLGADELMEEQVDVEDGVNWSDNEE